MKDLSVLIVGGGAGLGALLAKMAVDERYQGRGYGRLILQAVIDHAGQLGAKRLFIETSSKLPAAIALYEKLGFAHLPADRVPPSEYARVDVYMERWL